MYEISAFYTRIKLKTKKVGTIFSTIFNCCKFTILKFKWIIDMIKTELCIFNILSHNFGLNIVVHCIRGCPENMYS